MGNDLSSSITPPPLSLNDCVVNGELDIARCYVYKRRVQRDKNQIDALNAIEALLFSTENLELSFKISGKLIFY